jgi:hypothetical protein
MNERGIPMHGVHTDGAPSRSLFRHESARTDSLDAQTRFGRLVFGAEGMASHGQIEEQLDAI